jgi:hypothetical protein
MPRLPETTITPAIAADISHLSSFGFETFYDQVGGDVNSLIVRPDFMSDRLQGFLREITEDPEGQRPAVIADLRDSQSSPVPSARHEKNYLSHEFKKCLAWGADLVLVNFDQAAPTHWPMLYELGVRTIIDSRTARLSSAGVAQHAEHTIKLARILNPDHEVRAVTPTDDSAASQRLRVELAGHMPVGASMLYAPNVPGRRTIGDTVAVAPGLALSDEVRAITDVGMFPWQAIPRIRHLKELAIAVATPAPVQHEGDSLPSLTQDQLALLPRIEKSVGHWWE